MPDSLRAALSGHPLFPAPLLLEQIQVKRCHVSLPDTPKPIGAIVYQERFYSFVKFYSDLEAAKRGAERLILRGNGAVITYTAKGYMIWVWEPEARLAKKP